jgi:hypothetical protein
MASAFGTNTSNYSSSDQTNNKRMLTNYNYVKKLVNPEPVKNCLSSSNGNIKLVKSKHGEPTLYKLSNVSNYELLSDITKGYYSPRSCSIAPPNLYTDEQEIAKCLKCKPDPDKTINQLNIDGDMEFGLYYTNFNLTDNILVDISGGSTYNTLKSDNSMVDGDGNYIIDPKFILFSDKECVNNNIKQLNNKSITVKPQYTDPNIDTYKKTTNSDLFKIKYNVPIYFKPV